MTPPSPHARSPRALLCTLLLASVASLTAHAAPPEGFTNELVLSGLAQPINIEFLPDGRALVLEKAGAIYITDPDGIPPVASPYMTIPDVDSGGERGLLAIVLDPDFDSNSYFYVYYAKASRVLFRIARFTHLGSTGDLASEFVVWENPQDLDDCCHYGGGLDIGPDGALYLTTGDGFDGLEAQDPATAAGKIIRVNTDGSVPVDNPLIDGPGGNVDEIYAIGLRNPFRAIWDLPTGRFLIAEVGGNDQNSAMEDLHLGRLGANYGWPFCEGPCADPLFDDPIFSYPHSGDGASIIGGFVYRGASFPLAYDAAYFYADYVRGWIRYLTFAGDGSVDGDFPFDPTAGAVSAMSEGPDGALYFVDIVTGELRRILFEQGNRRPVITQASADVTSGDPPLTVTFTGSASDPESQPLDFHWIFGDSAEADGNPVVHDYIAAGVYSVRLRVSDGIHTVFSDPFDITVGSPPTATILTPIDAALFRGGDEISLTGSGTDPDGALSEAGFSWVVSFVHNEHEHPAMGAVQGTSTTFAIDDSGHDYSDDTGYQVSLTVTDDDGLSDTATVNIYPDKVDVTFDAVPSGSTILLDGIARSTPFVHDTLIDFNHQVSAPLQQCLDGNQYEFDFWSDGGAANHVITVPDADYALTASYFQVGICGLRTTDGLQVLYDFSAGMGGTVFDRSGLIPALDLTINDPTAVTWLAGGGLSVDSPTALVTPNPATRLGTALRASEALTVEAWVMPAAGVDQFGPARIVAYSENGFPDGGNFMLGQTYDSSSGQSAYAGRLRTTATNKYGTPNLETPLGLATSTLTHLVYTRDAGGHDALLRRWCGCRDGEPRRHVCGLG